ncbi:MAG: type II toxin-antitoxin system VapC family toxin [Terriglobales bacterium]
MTRYFDASAWTKRYIDEPGTDAVVGLAEGAVLATSRLTMVEVSSALLRRKREGTVGAAVCDEQLARLRSELLTVEVVELDLVVAEAATATLQRHALRAGDAIQLASALHLRRRMRGPIEFICFDQRLNEAARAEGLLTPVS